MEYRVELIPAAERDADEYYAFILSKSNDSLAADKWWSGLEKSILSLSQIPMRLPKIPESNDFRTELRQLIYESHRIIFSISAKPLE